MNQQKTPPDPAATHPHPMLEEDDIGSGEKPPSQEETEELIRRIPPLPPAGKPGQP